MLLVYLSIFQCFNALFSLEYKGYDFNFSLSQTYYITSQNEYLMEDAHDGSFQWTEGVANVIKQWDQLQFGAQLLVRDFGDEGNFDLDIDWAYFDYAVNDSLGFRLGRVRQPYGFYNEYRDADASRMELLFPQVFNSEDFRAGAAAYQGLSIYGTLSFERMGSLQYQAYYGDNYLREDFFMTRQARKAYSSPNTRMRTKEITGLHLIWNTPKEGLAINYTYLYYRGYFDLSVPIGPGVFLTDDRGIDLKIQWHLLGFEYSFGEWQCVAEFLNRSNDGRHSTIISAHPFIDPVQNNRNIVAGYFTLRRQWLDSFGSFVSYGVLVGDIASEGQGISGKNNLQETTLGFRYDINDNFIFKMQGSNMMGAYGVIAPKDPSTHWQMFTTRLTCVF